MPGGHAARPDADTRLRAVYLELISAQAEARPYGAVFYACVRARKEVSYAIEAVAAENERETTS